MKEAILSKTTGQTHWPVVAGVLLVDSEGSILLQRRGATAPTSPNTWGTPGGHLEPDETAEEAVHRELLEETGLRTSEPLTLFMHFLICRKYDGSIHFVKAADTTPPDANIIRDVSIFYGTTTARLEDLVLGEGDGLAFVSPQEALQLELAISTSYVLPLFLNSPEYRQLIKL